MEERKRLFLGDTHSINVVRTLIKNKNLTNLDIYHVGDFGLGFTRHDIEDLDKLNDCLIERDINLYVNRGNHDDPEWWKKQLYITDNLKLVDSYNVINKTLFIGGAVSIDRFDRITSGTGWWKEEIFDYKNGDINITGINTVITHTAPDFCEPLLFNSLVNYYINKESKHNVNSLKNDLITERSLVTEVYKKLIKKNKIKNWYYGHFHNNYFLNHNDTFFRCIDINNLI
jgi:predicted phosphodiesterase